MSTVYEENERTIDSSTGEIIEEWSQARWKNEEPPYVKLYIEAWCVFKNMKGVNASLLYLLLPHMQYAAGEDGQTLTLAAAQKKRIAEKLGWGMGSYIQRFSKEMKKLCDAGALVKLGQNYYRVNPELIGRGEWKDIRRLKPQFDLETGKVAPHGFRAEERQPKRNGHWETNENMWSKMKKHTTADGSTTITPAA